MPRSPRSRTSAWTRATRGGRRSSGLRRSALRVSERRGAIVRLDGPGPKTGKNRLHLDVHTGSVAELEALGATVLDDTLPWTVMADP